MTSEAKPYWLWFSEVAIGEDARGDCVSTPDDAGRLHGELFTAIVDRLGRLGVNVSRATDELQSVAAELEKCGVQQDTVVKTLLRKQYYSAADTGRIANIMDLKRAVANVKQYAALAEECAVEDFTRLRELSGTLFTDMRKAYRMIELLGMNTNGIDLRLNDLKRAIGSLSNSFNEYMLAHYTDYFDGFYPVTIVHLGYMVQCAAIVDKVLHHELAFTATDRKPGDPIIYPARMYKELLNWFNEDLHDGSEGEPDQEWSRNFDGFGEDADWNDLF